jgi:hypothetical protein
MAEVVYGLFEGVEQARAGAKALTSRTDEHPAFRTKLFTKAPLDGDDLPEAATDVGGNTVLHTAIGAVTCTVMGAAAGGAGIIPGLSVGMGIAMGMIFGIFAGGLNGLMAGTRTPKPELRELEDKIKSGQALLVVEASDGAQAKLVMAKLESLGAPVRGRC